MPRGQSWFLAAGGDNCPSVLEGGCHGSPRAPGGLPATATAPEAGVSLVPAGEESCERTLYLTHMGFLSNRELPCC